MVAGCAELLIFLELERLLRCRCGGFIIRPLAADALTSGMPVSEWGDIEQVDPPGVVVGWDFIREIESRGASV